MRLLARGLIVAAAVFAASGHAQTWPVKPVRLVVNVPPGSSVDVVARIYVAHLSDALGQPVVIEYRAGAGGSIGIETVAKSAPDGYTLLNSAGSMMILVPHLYKLSFDIGKDLDAVVPTARPAVFLIVRSGLPIRSVADLIAYARANPEKLNFGSPGVGTGLHIASEMLLSSAKVRATHVSYKGAAQVLADLLGGQIDYTFDPGPAIPHIKSGRVRLLAVANAGRSSIFPEAPTMAEAGLDVDVGFQHGVFAPAGTPREIVMRLNREIGRIMMTTEARVALMAIAAEPVTSSPEDFAAQQHRDRERFGVIMREAGIRAE